MGLSCKRVQKGHQSTALCPLGLTARGGPTAVTLSQVDRAHVWGQEKTVSVCGHQPRRLPLRERKSRSPLPRDRKALKLGLQCPNGSKTKGLKEANSTLSLNYKPRWLYTSQTTLPFSHSLFRSVKVTTWTFSPKTNSPTTPRHSLTHHVSLPMLTTHSCKTWGAGGGGQHHSYLVIQRNYSYVKESHLLPFH